MDAIRFDSVAKLFANRRLSRRQAVTGASAGLAATALGGGLARTAGAQGATPAATPETVDMSDAEPTSTQLFVQSFQSGSLAPSTSEFGTHTVTLEQGMGQTIVFTDRPSREVGTSPTPAFLDGLGFDADNPPNAAIVIDAGDGATEIAVVELFNPSYDEATHTATYDIAVLANWQNDLELGFQQEPADLSNVAADFGATHLFIDGCTGNYNCGWWNEGSPDIRGRLWLQATWWWGEFGCVPDAPNAETIDDVRAYWAQKCNETFAECEGECILWW